MESLSHLQPLSGLLFWVGSSQTCPPQPQKQSHRGREEGASKQFYSFYPVLADIQNLPGPSCDTYFTAFRDQSPVSWGCIHDLAQEKP